MRARRLSACSDEELLAGVIAGLIGDARHVAVGNASPIPATAALPRASAATAGRMFAPATAASDNFFTAGGCELFDCAGQGRIDVFFLSGGQIGGEAINLVSIGDCTSSVSAFPGSFGSGYLYYVVPRVILFRRSIRGARWCRRSISSARRERRRTSTGPAGRSRWSPTAACFPSIATASASGSRACIRGTRWTR